MVIDQQEYEGSVRVYRIADKKKKKKKKKKKTNATGTSVS